MKQLIFVFLFVICHAIHVEAEPNYIEARFDVEFGDGAFSPSIYSAESINSIVFRFYKDGVWNEGDPTLSLSLLSDEGDFESKLSPECDISFDYSYDSSSEAYLVYILWTNYNILISIGTENIYAITFVKMVNGQPVTSSYDMPYDLMTNGLSLYKNLVNILEQSSKSGIGKKIDILSKMY